MNSIKPPFLSRTQRQIVRGHGAGCRHDSRDWRRPPRNSPPATRRCCGCKGKAAPAVPFRCWMPTPSGPAKLLTRYINLVVPPDFVRRHRPSRRWTTVNKIIAAGGYILIVEGAVPAGMPKACTFGGELFGDQLRARRQSGQGGDGGRFLRGVWRNSRRGKQSHRRRQRAAISEGQGVSHAHHFDPRLSVSSRLVAGHRDPCAQAGHPAAGCAGPAQGVFLPAHARPMPALCRLRAGDDSPGLLARTAASSSSAASARSRTPTAPCGQWNGGVNSCIRAGAPCIGCGGEQFAAKAGPAVHHQKTRGAESGINTHESAFQTHSLAGRRNRRRCLRFPWASSFTATPAAATAGG